MKTLYIIYKKVRRKSRANDSATEEKTMERPFSGSISKNKIEKGKKTKKHCFDARST